MNYYEMIKEAIKNKKQIFLVYNGKQRGLCPHIIGKKEGKEKCLCYQFSGESSSSFIKDGDSNNWRCLEISKIKSLEVRDGDWHTSSNYSSSKQPCINEIDLEVV